MKKIAIPTVFLFLAACGGDESAVSAESLSPSDEQRAAQEPDFAAASPAAPVGGNAPLLEPEPIPSVVTLPADYPSSWFFAHDMNFFNMLDAKVVLLDAAAKTREYKGQLPAGLAAGFAYSNARNEIYVTETIHERRVRGPRHDYLVAYDVENLQPKYEVELPNVRYQGMPYEWGTQLIDGDRFLLQFNFSPAASVTVVDLDSREVVNQVNIPGCAMIYPTGARGFSTLCGNAGMTTIKLDENGQTAEETKTEPFFDIDNDALFMGGVVIGGIGYFPTFLGDMQPVDFRGAEPVVMERWSLLSEEERAENLRPGGWQFATSDGEEEIFVLIHGDGAEGTHKNPSADVYVYSAADRKKLRQLTLKNPAISIMTTGGETPYLVAFNVELEIDIYDATSGEWLRKIGGLATETPFAFYPVR